MPPHGFANNRLFCYLNACLQALLHAPAFVRGIRMPDLVEATVLKHPNADVEETARIVRDTLTYELLNLQNEAGPVVRATGFRRRFLAAHGGSGSLGDTWEMQDSHEGLADVVNRIHEEMSVKASPIPKSESESENAVLTLAQKFNDFLDRQDMSAVCSMMSVVSCVSKLYPCCGAQHHPIEDQLTFLVSLPSNERTGSNLDLADCLAHETRQVTIEDTATCERCKSVVSPHEQHSILHASDVVVLCLKRFYNDGSATFKNRVGVNAPLEGFDLGKHMTPPRPLTYRLCAVIDHHGSLDVAHYTANVLHDGNWYRCNDARVSLINDVTRVVTEDCYVLFYVREQ